MDTGGAHAAIVGDQHVLPLPDRQRLGRLHPHAEIAVAEGEVQPQFAIQQVQAVAFAFEIVLADRENRALR